MKKLMLAAAGAAVALSPLAASPAAAADFSGHNRGRYEQVQNHDRFNNRRVVVKKQRVVVKNRYVNNNHFQRRRWQRGERFDSRYASNYMMISNPNYYNLRPAPYGYRWVRSGDDAVLIAITSGIIGAVLANAF